MTIGPALAGSVWKIFSEGSIRPSFEMITRNGYGLCPRAPRSSRNFGSDRPSRTLSCRSVLCPISTASPSARWRNKCVLSSRDVKSTGEKFLVVILPSTVMAKVAATKGRFGGTCFCTSCLLRSGIGAFGRAEARPSGDDLFFLLANFMLERGEFLFHIAHLHMANRAARPVKEVDHSTGQTAEQDHAEAGEPNEPGGGKPIIGRRSG